MSELFLTAFLDMYGGTEEDAQAEYEWRDDEEVGTLILAWAKVKNKDVSELF